MRWLALALNWSRSAIRERQGASAVEFALLTPVLVGLLIPTVDIGMGLYTKMQVQNAVQAGAQYAAARGFDSTGIQNAVTSATGLSSITALPVPAQSCGCVSGTSITSASCSTTCPDGSTAGVYVTVNAQSGYRPLFPYPVLGNAMTLAARTTVRIQ
jgi:Flp pilus assembly protein TadG